MNCSVVEFKFKKHYSILICSAKSLLLNLILIPISRVDHSFLGSDRCTIFNLGPTDPFPVAALLFIPPSCH